MSIEKMLDLEYCTGKFSNGVEVINATPRSIRFQDGDKIVEIPSSVKEGEKTGPFVINASVETMPSGNHLVKSVFTPSEEGEKLIKVINAIKPDAFIIGSIIAAQAYPGKVVGMVPAPGFERVPPAEKRMSCEQFTTFA